MSKSINQLSVFIPYTKPNLNFEFIRSHFADKLIGKVTHLLREDYTDNSGNPYQTLIIHIDIHDEVNKFVSDLRNGLSQTLYYTENDCWTLQLYKPSVTKPYHNEGYIDYISLLEKQNTKLQNMNYELNKYSSSRNRLLYKELYDNFYIYERVEELEKIINEKNEKIDELETKLEEECLKNETQNIEIEKLNKYASSRNRLLYKESYDTFYIYERVEELEKLINEKNEKIDELETKLEVACSANPMWHDITTKKTDWLELENKRLQNKVEELEKEVMELGYISGRINRINFEDDLKDEKDEKEEGECEDDDNQSLMPFMYNESYDENLPPIDIDSEIEDVDDDNSSTTAVSDSLPKLSIKIDIDDNLYICEKCNSDCDINGELIEDVIYPEEIERTEISMCNKCWGNLKSEGYLDKRGVHYDKNDNYIGHFVGKKYVSKEEEEYEEYGSLHNEKKKASSPKSADYIYLFGYK